MQITNAVRETISATRDCFRQPAPAYQIPILRTESQKTKTRKTNLFQRGAEARGAAGSMRIIVAASKRGVLESVCTMYE
jgi:hypothetical protein